MADTPRQMADALRGRLDALARAHELIRPVIAVDEPLQQTTSVDEIVRAVLAPHVHDGFPHQMSVEGEPIPIGAKAATSLSLVLHELATNAAKYGALSVHDGQLRIRWMQDGAGFTLSWQEENGPRIDGPPETEGFGSQLTRRSITGQLGGTIAYDWRPEGLRIRIELPRDQFSL
jgi:two-component sensor histidine kinase